MLARIEKASNLFYKDYKEINTLEELLKIYPSLIIETSKHIIDLCKEEHNKIDCIVIIYDDYVE